MPVFVVIIIAASLHWAIQGASDSPLFLLNSAITLGAVWGIRSYTAKTQPFLEGVPINTDQAVVQENAVDKLLIATHKKFAAHFSCAQEDLQQVQSLLSDAITKLLRSFQGMHDLISQQPTAAHGQEVKSAVCGSQDIGLSQHLEESADTLRVSLKSDIDHCNADIVRVGNSMLGDAVTALQFQDMVNQLLQHSVQRLDHMHSAWMLIANVASQNQCGVSVLPQQLEQVTQEINRILELAEHVDAHNPVRQEHMESGNIELF